jgi:hypothetical protein
MAGWFLDILVEYLFRVSLRAIRNQGDDVGMCTGALHDYPEAQPVRFRFVEDGISGRGLCDQLKISGKKTVLVALDTCGSSVRGLVGFNEISIDGKQIVNVGGWGSSGSPDRVHPHPLKNLYKNPFALSSGK